MWVRGVVGGERVHSLSTLSLQEVHMALEGDDLKEVTTSLPAHYTSTLNADISVSCRVSCLVDVLSVN